MGLCNANNGGTVARGTTDRGVGEGIGYILALGVLVAFISALLLIGGQFFQDANADVAQDQVQTEAQSLAGEIESVDRAVRETSGSGEVRSVIAAPTRRGGESFEYNITHDTSANEGKITILDSGEEVGTVQFRSMTSIEETTVSGERFEILRPSGSSTIEIRVIGES